MKSVDMQVKGDMLTIKIDLSRQQGPSSSGKSILVATTEGNVSVPEHDAAKVGLNVYKKPGG